MHTIHVSTKPGYDVFVGRGLVEKLPQLVGARLGKVKQAAILSDETVYALHGAKLEKALDALGVSRFSIVVAPGEESKSIATYETVLNELCEKGLSRNGVLFALGGGVVGDLCGFVAATYLRGIRFVQLPTTLLAAVDASVGGKTALNLAAGKNLVGAFYQPEAVICDCDLLDTLPADIFADGMAEVIKCAMLDDAPLFASLEAGGVPVEEIIARCIGLKARVVAADERDTGLRQLLNFGHSFGHSIEKESAFAISHGKAVAIGMAMMTRACEARGLCEAGTAARLCSLLEKWQLPTASPYDAATVFAHLGQDKKRMDDAITLVICQGIGQCALQKTPMDSVFSYVQEGM